MIRDLGTPFPRPDTKPLIYSNEKGLEDLEKGMGEAMAAVLGTEGPLPKEDPFNSSLPDAPPDALESFITEQEKTLRERMKEAEAIFNKETPEGKTERHFFGPEQIKEAFGIELLLADVPEIPYSKERLERAEKQGYELVLRIARDDKNQPMTALHIYHLLKEKHGGGKNSWGETWMVNGKEAKILSQDPEIEFDPTDPDNEGREDPRPTYIRMKEYFFFAEPLKTAWKLEARAVLPDSKNKNYVEQTRLLRDTLRAQGALTEEEEVECIDQKLAELTILMDRNWVEVAKQLVALKLIQNHRRSFVEALYGQFLRQATGGPNFKNSFMNDLVSEWTRSPSLAFDGRDDGDFVLFGSIHRPGAAVSRCDSRNRRFNLLTFPTC